MASRAYLIEPHWYWIRRTANIAFVTNRCRNPTLEEQALARIHRIGQTSEVTTIRFYVKDSFEEVSKFVLPSRPFEGDCVH